MEETESLVRGKNFIENFNKVGIVGSEENVSSGFWLSVGQLHQLAEDLEKQDSSGIGLMVGCRNSDEGKTLFSVEIVPLSGKVEKYFANFLGDDIKITVIEDSGNFTKGYINSKLPILHNSIDSSEAQRFPPPEN